MNERDVANLLGVDARTAQNAGMSAGAARRSACATGRFLLLLLIAAACLGQSETEPYFALFTTRTFGTGDKPSVQLSAWNVDSLEFRVYRIHDPVAFFEQLPDPHQFGGQAPRRPGELTLIERIHEWKRSLRAGIRVSIRQQFSESPRARLGLIQTGKPEPPKKAGKQGPGHSETHYAEAPLLNSQQLVMSFQQPVRGNSRWERETVEFGLKEKGFYLVEAVKDQLCAYSLLMISDIAIVTKPAGDQMFNFVVDRRSGQPVAGAKLTALTRDQRLGEAETNPDGIARLGYGDKHVEDLRLIARRGDDFAVNLTNAASRSEREQWESYPYTDRPVYRPGHTVHFKMLLRLRTPSGYALPSGRSVSVQVMDPDQKPVYQKTLAVSANGSIHDEIPLAATAALGPYFMQVKSGDTFVGGGSFEVQEYKKPEYEVRVLPAKGRILEGETTQVTVDSRYFFGEPVANAKVTYGIYRDTYYFPLWYDADEDTGSDQADTGDTSGNNADNDSDSGDQVGQQEGQTDADGKMVLTLPTKLSDRKEDFVYRIEAQVIDQGKRAISGTAWVVATYGSFLVHATPDAYIYTPGGKAVMTVEALDYDRKPVSARVHVELLRWSRRDPNKMETVSGTDVDTGVQGSAKAELTLPNEGGSYRVKVSSHTPEGRDIESFTYLWVSGGGSFDFGGSEQQAVQIVADKKSYKAGDTAHLMVIAGQPGTAVLVTREGRALSDYKVVRSQDATISYDVPVTAADEPGIIVVASFMRGGVFHEGNKYLKVPPVEHKLNVKLSTDKPQYQPGQTADYTIEATSQDGRPVPNADFSLGVVDEAIYSIRQDDTPYILNSFFGREWNRVFSTNSLEYWFQGEAGKRRMRLAELRPPSRLAQLKPERLVQPKIRKVFPDTAFWAADLTTDGGGRAHARVEFPDSLTTWRATTRGSTPDTKVGAAVLKTIVRKNLIVRPVVPRFFVQGDEVTISLLVHNYLTDGKKARVSLDVKGLDVLSGTTQDIDIPSRGEVKVDWRVRAQQVRSATITGKALTNEESDAIELELPVNVPGIPQARSHGGAMNAGGAASFSLAFPDKVEPGSRTLNVRLAPSIAGSLFGALDYLTSFPYGCVEQTMSSFLPNITVAQAVKDLGIKTDLDQAALAEKINSGLERLYNFQHDDGGWGWWETDDSHPFMTAYVVAGLVQAKNAGISVNQQAIDKAVNWVKNDLAEDSQIEPDLRAYMTYALAVAKQANTETLDRAEDKMSAMSPYGQAMLGLAMDEAGDARGKQLAALLERSAKQDSEQAWWPATRDEMLDFSEDVTPEATAWAVKLISREHADSPLLPKAALWLMNHRSEGYWWDSTKQTAMVIYGLTDYLRHTNELNPNLTVTVFVNDKQVLTKKIDQVTAVAAPDLVLDESQLRATGNQIRITTSGAGRLYYSARAEYSSSDEKLQKTGTVSLNLLRDYFRLAPTRNGEKIVYDLTPLSGPVASGDTIAVRLTVTGTDWKYLMIEDPIPAGTEFVERDNLYELKDRPPWWQWTFTRRELHDNRMALFQTYFLQGQTQYFYLLKVVNPGVFQVSPARVSPMYQSGVMATTESRKLEVK